MVSKAKQDFKDQPARPVRLVSRAPQALKGNRGKLVHKVCKVMLVQQARKV